MKEKIESVKQQLGSDLVVSEEHYFELKSLKDDHLTLKDWVLMRVYETVSRFQQDTEKARKEAKQSKEQALSLGDQLESVKTELAHTRRVGEERSNDANRRCNEYLARSKELEGELNRAKSQIDEMKEKNVRFDEVSEQLKDALAKDKANQLQLTAQVGTIKQQNEEIKDLTNEMQKIKQEIGILNTDKAFLQKENVIQGEKNRRLEDKNDQLIKDLEETKKKMAEYVDKLLNTKDDVVSKYESKYLDQLNDLKERHKVFVLYNNIIERNR